MGKTIEVDDATTIGIKMIGWGKWNVTVNGVVLTVESEKLSFASHDIRFQLADGRKAVIAQRPQPGGGPTFDTRVGAEELVDPGKHSFKCPACRAVVRPRDRSCTRCSAPQPNATQRIEERCRQSASRGLGMRAILLSVWVASTVFTRGVGTPQARAGLQAAQATAGAAHGARAPVSIGGLAIWATALAVTVGCAALARRAPVEACWLNFGTWFGVFAVSSFINPHLSFLGLAFIVFLLWNTARMARYARAALGFTFPA